MEPWGWILVYLVGFTLFQLLLFRYFADDRALGGASLGSSETSAPQRVERGQPPRETSQQPANDGDGVHCRNCGTRNDDEQHYTYCRNCLTQLH